MATIRPFKALRPVPEKAKDVSSVPYDVVDTGEARILAQGNPLSFLHVIRPEIDLPEGTYLYDESVYSKASENLKKLIQKNVLIQEKPPSIYIYRLSMGDHSQTGVAACCAVEEYDKNIIRKHELTRKEKEDDRLKHMLTISAHPGPVIFTYRGTERTNAITSEEVKNPPLYNFVDPDGVRHTIWRMGKTGEIVNAFNEIPCLYIADGHHRVAGAGRVKKVMAERHRDSTGQEEFNYFLAVMFPADQLQIFAYNRYIKDLNDLNENNFLKRIEERFELTYNGKKEPDKKGIIGMYLNGRWYELHIPEDLYDTKDPVASLDLSVFQKSLLEPVFSIKDQKNDKRIDFIGGPDNVEKLIKRVNENGGVAFTFYPVNINELLAVADAERIMPPKSTWFAPKLRSGLLIHQF